VEESGVAVLELRQKHILGHVVLERPQVRHNALYLDIKGADRTHGSEQNS
jgi:hypothetical protein